MQVMEEGKEDVVETGEKKNKIRGSRSKKKKKRKELSHKY